MKGKSLLFGSQNLTGRWSSKATKNSLKKTNKSLNLKNHIVPHKLPIVHIPNSHIEQHDDSGKLIRIRYYDENGNAYKDVDYDDHGRPDTHKIPHTHIIEIGTIIDRKKEQVNMKIDNFIKLVKQGFDVSFNYKDVFYTISLLEEKDGIKKYGIGSDTGYAADFESLDSIPDFVLEDKTIGKIVSELDEDEIYY